MRNAKNLIIFKMKILICETLQSIYLLGQELTLLQIYNKIYENC